MKRFACLVLVLNTLPMVAAARQQWQRPVLNPTITQFGQVTTVALNLMRFFTFGLRTTF